MKNQTRAAHGNTNNKNALKPAAERADSLLHIRVSAHDKSGWVKQAQKNGMNLSEWAISRLNAYQLGEK